MAILFLLATAGVGAGLAAEPPEVEGSASAACGTDQTARLELASLAAAALRNDEGAQSKLSTAIAGALALAAPGTPDSLLESLRVVSRDIVWVKVWHSGHDDAEKVLETVTKTLKGLHQLAVEKGTSQQRAVIDEMLESENGIRAALARSRTLDADTPSHLQEAQSHYRTLDALGGKLVEDDFSSEDGLNFGDVAQHWQKLHAASNHFYSYLSQLNRTHEQMEDLVEAKGVINDYLQRCREASG